jgi:hypothetical protein
MRVVSFQFLWLFWAGGLAYSLLASWIGIFPEITLRTRLADNVTTAWFIAGAWIAVWIYDHFSSPRPDRKQP